MEGFQKFVLLAAIIILIISLVIIGFALNKTKKDQQWPPMIPECPDYWTLNGTGSTATCYNELNLGNCSNDRTMNFNASNFVGAQGMCNKYKWATRCGVSWDGITYGVKNPCFQS